MLEKNVNNEIVDSISAADYRYDEVSKNVHIPPINNNPGNAHTYQRRRTIPTNNYHNNDMIKRFDAPKGTPFTNRTGMKRKNTSNVVVIDVDDPEPKRFKNNSVADTIE